MAISKKIKLPNSPKVKAHCLKIGEIVYLWNQIHAVIFMSFSRIVGNNQEKSLKFMWDDAGSDNVQRRLVKAYLKGLPEHEALDEIIWYLCVIDDLSQYRNAFIHTPMLDSTIEGGVVPINFASKDSFMKNIKKIHEEKLFTKFKKDLIELNQFSFDVLKSFSGNKELPPRPVLRAFPDLPSGKQKRKNRRVTKSSSYQRGLAAALMGKLPLKK